MSEHPFEHLPLESRQGFPVKSGARLDGEHGAVREPGRHFRFHDLRHFAVSALIAEGADIKLLQAIVGHASATMTLDTYGHLMTARVSEAATRYDPLAASASG